VRQLPEQAVLDALLSYCPETGALTWKERTPIFFDPSDARSAEHICNLWNVRYAGTPALAAIGKLGYRTGRLLGKESKSHRVIWKLITGVDPLEVDHINRDRADNRWSNLRAVTRSENVKNRTMQKNNQTGHTGIYRKESSWLAYVTVNKQRVHLGSFRSLEDAISARLAALSENGFSQGHGAFLAAA
jgi:hypothetical protein